MGGKKEESSQPTISWQQSPEYQYQMDLFKQIQDPWMKSQYGLYKDVFEPQTRQLGGVLGEQLRQPLSLPEDVWANTWQKGKANVAAQYAPMEQKATERAAGSGMLGQGATEKYMQQLDLSKAKSIEDMSIDMAIQEWNEKKQAKQQAISNMMAFQGLQPQFNLQMPQSQMFVQQPSQQQRGNYGGLGSLAGAAALGGLSLLVPGTGIGIGGLTGGQLAGIGAGLGGGLGSMFSY